MTYHYLDISYIRQKDISSLNSISRAFTVKSQNFRVGKHLNGYRTEILETLCGLSFISIFHKIKRLESKDHLL